MKRSQQRYDIDYVRQAAKGQWIGIISHIGGISADLLDSRHHPCPKPECPAKTDGFRAFDDVAETGGVICNQCFNRDNNDGWKTLQWLTGKKFGDLLPEVADYIGIKPDVSKTEKKSRSKERTDDPAKHLQWMPWNDLLASYFCIAKRPIATQAIHALHGRFARYRKQCTVIAIPIWGEMLTEADPIGWTLYNHNGGTVNSYVWNEQAKEYEPKPEKILTTFGSDSGIIGPVEKLRDAKIVWKLEGPSDVLAFYSLKNIPENVVAITNSCGAKEKPKDWLVQLMAGKTVHVLHDADAAGRDGAIGFSDTRGRWRAGWCGALSKTAKEVFLVNLPYPLSEDGGKDLRDFLADAIP